MLASSCRQYILFVWTDCSGCMSLSSRRYEHCAQSLEKAFYTIGIPCLLPDSYGNFLRACKSKQKYRKHPCRCYNVAKCLSKIKCLVLQYRTKSTVYCHHRNFSVSHAKQDDTSENMLSNERPSLPALCPTRGCFSEFSLIVKT